MAAHYRALSIEQTAMHAFLEHSRAFQKLSVWHRNTLCNRRPVLHEVIAPIGRSRGRRNVIVPISSEQIGAGLREADEGSALVQAIERGWLKPGARDGTLRGGRLPTRECLTMTVWIYVNTSKQVGDKDHLKVFANEDAAETWLQENDPEGVAFEYEVPE
jgi:hypothetical protein